MNLLQHYSGRCSLGGIFFSKRWDKDWERKIKLFSCLFFFSLLQFSKFIWIFHLLHQLIFTMVNNWIEPPWMINHGNELNLNRNNYVNIYNQLICLQLHWEFNVLPINNMIIIMIGNGNSNRQIRIKINLNSLFYLSGFMLLSEFCSSFNGKLWFHKIDSLVYFHFTFRDWIWFFMFSFSFSA